MSTKALLPLNRRNLMKLVATLAAGAPAVAQVSAGRSGDATPQRISKEMVAAALGVMGLTFTDPQLDMLLPVVNRSLTNYEGVRRIDIPLDTAPAISFSPLVPGFKFPRSSSYKPPKAPALLKFKQPEELAFLPAVQLGAMVRSKKITSTVLTKMYLERLKLYAPKLNCVITLTEDLALEQAKQADASQRRGKILSPLHGVPFGAKDLFDTKGILTTWGAEPYRQRMATSDATVIERLRAAGAVLVAKLSMGSLAQGGLWFGGMTKTPWNYEMTSSGSSAGSGSATAAGLVGFSIGTETLGSIVSPSTRCGVAGVRPTFGRVPKTGAMALSWTMDKIGPLCRSMADCAEVLRILNGPDGIDLTAISAPFNWDARRSVKGMKIGYLSAEIERLGEKTKPIYDAAFAVLRKAGASLQPMSLPEFPVQSIRYVLDAEAAAAFDDLTRQEGGLDKLTAQTPGDWPNQFRSSRLIPAVEYIRAQRARTLYMAKFEEFMRDWDAFVSTPQSASLTATNLTGNPQAVVPCGFVDGLPQGLLFTGRLFDESAPMRLALAYEQATDWHNQHPVLQT